MYRYVYCIINVIDVPQQNILGLGNTGIRFLKYREIAAVVSSVSSVKIPASNENALCHASVIETIQKEQTVLPIRFSSVLKNDEEVLEFLKKHYEIFVSDLERLHNKLEMGLRIVMRNVNQKNAGSIKPDAGRYAAKRDQTRGAYGFMLEKSTPGMDYLEYRRACYSSQDEINGCIQEIADTCHAQFEGVYTEYKMDTHPSFLHGISLNYLICKDSLSEFRVRFHDLMASLDEFWFLCSGPWPPYHFVSLGNQKT